MTEPGKSAGEVARLLGVAATTIRTWDHRYGLGPSERQPGRHRRYEPADVQRLRRMRELTTQGVAPADAARLAQQPEPPSPTTATTDPDLASRRRGLRRAAAAMDVRRMEDILANAIDTDVVAAWTDLICPVLINIGNLTARTGANVEIEHLLSVTISAALAHRAAPNGPPQVLLACVPEEQHTLALEALTAALHTKGVGCRMIGARVPLDALQAAITRTGPTAVVLWAHATELADAAILHAVKHVRPTPALLMVGGPGWSSVELPPGTVYPTDLPGALAELATVTPATV